jgi:hypothetical protein
MPQPKFEDHTKWLRKPRNLRSKRKQQRKQQRKKQKKNGQGVHRG